MLGCEKEKIALKSIYLSCFSLIKPIKKQEAIRTIYNNKNPLSSGFSIYKIDGLNFFKFDSKEIKPFRFFLLLLIPITLV